MIPEINEGRKRKGGIPMNRRIRNCLFFIIISPLFLLNACDPGAVYDKSVAIKAGKWYKNDTLTFEALITDTISPNNLYICLRNKGSYPYSNLYLFVTSTSPGGASRHDTLELPLSDARGHWYGKGFGDLWEHQQLFKQVVRFPYPGVYVFTISQAMRADMLEGVMDVGIRIEKVK
jgi:gliding motility-associated lipoprotein GldH